MADGADAAPALPPQAKLVLSDIAERRMKDFPWLRITGPRTVYCAICREADLPIRVGRDLSWKKEVEVKEGGSGKDTWHKKLFSYHQDSSSIHKDSLKAPKVRRDVHDLLLSAPSDERQALKKISLLRNIFFIMNFTYNFFK